MDRFLPISMSDVCRFVEQLQEAPDTAILGDIAKFARLVGYEFRYRGDRLSVVFHCPRTGHHFHIGLDAPIRLLYYYPHTAIHCTLFDDDGTPSRTTPSALDVTIDRLLNGGGLDVSTDEIVDGSLLILYHHMGRWHIASPRTPDIQHSYNFTAVPIYKTVLRVLKEQAPNALVSLGAREDGDGLALDGVPTTAVFSLKLKSMDALPYTDHNYEPLEYCVMGSNYHTPATADADTASFAATHSIPLEHTRPPEDGLTLGTVKRVVDTSRPEKITVSFVSRGPGFETMARILLAPTLTDSISRRFAKVYERLEHEMARRGDDPMLSRIAVGLARLDSPHKFRM